MVVALPRTESRHRLQGGSRFVGVLWVTLAIAMAALATEAKPAEKAPPLFPAFMEARVDERLPLPQWEKMIESLRRDGARVEACRADPGCDDRPARRLLDFTERQMSGSRSQLIAAVNTFVNAVPYVSDAVKFGTEDRWQSPLDFLDGAGDCEDYVIAKYFLLRQLGVADDDLRIVITLESQGQVIHAVLAVTMDGGASILDNRSSGVRSSADYPTATPKYAVNASHRWVFVNLNGRAGGNGPTTNIQIAPAGTPGR